jgi:hypothetical protein
MIVEDQRSIGATASLPENDGIAACGENLDIEPTGSKHVGDKLRTFSHTDILSSDAGLRTKCDQFINMAIGVPSCLGVKFF